MRVSECSFLFISAIKFYNKASNPKEIHNSLSYIGDLLIVAKKSDIEVHFKKDEAGFIRKLTIGIKGKAKYYYTINDESITAGLKGE